MIAEREGYHARIFERRMKDLGIPCEAKVTDASLKITELLSDPKVSDNEKLLYLNSLAPDIDAFFTTRRDTGGTGMGLAIVQAVMTSHGGSIRLLPSDKGAAFELQFPAG